MRIRVINNMNWNRDSETTIEPEKQAMGIEKIKNGRINFNFPWPDLQKFSIPINDTTRLRVSEIEGMDL